MMLPRVDDGRTVRQDEAEDVVCVVVDVTVRKRADVCWCASLVLPPPLLLLPLWTPLPLPCAFPSILAARVSLGDGVFSVLRWCFGIYCVCITSARTWWVSNRPRVMGGWYMHGDDKEVKGQEEGEQVAGMK